MLPTASELSHFSDIFYDTNRLELFPMFRALPTIINAGLYPDLANSFLIVARQTHDAERIFPLKIFINNCPRKPKYQLRTEICKASTPSGFIVKKFARNTFAREHLNAVVENCQILSKIYGAEHVAQMELVAEDVAEMEYIDGISFEDYIAHVLEAEGVQELPKLFAFYWKNILRGTSDDNYLTSAIEFNFPDRRYEWDLHFRNIMIRDDNFVLFDYEFLLPSLPKKYIIARAFLIFCHNQFYLCQKLGITWEDLIDTLEISSGTLAEYKTLETKINRVLVDDFDLKYRKKRLPVKSFQI